MNKIQFWISIGLSSLITILLISHIFFVRAANTQQFRVSSAQQAVSQGQAAQAIMKQLAVRIFQDSQKNNDQALKDLLVRQGVTYNPSTETNSTDAPVAPPSTAPAVH